MKIEKFEQMTEEDFNKLSKKEIAESLNGLYVFLTYPGTNVCLYIQNVIFDDLLKAVVFCNDGMQQLLIPRKYLYTLVHKGVVMIDSTGDSRTNAICVLYEKEPVFGILGDVFDQAQTQFSGLVLWCQEHVMHNLPPEHQEELGWYLSDLEKLLRIERHD